MLPGPDHKLVYRSSDRGRTWTSAGTTNLHVGPRTEPPVQSLAPMGFMNLADGAVLAFLLHGRELHDNPLPLHTWGSWHCQAFCARSDDDGVTWSAPVNVDTPGFHDDGTPMEGNLDLTECTAVQLGQRPGSGLPAADLLTRDVGELVGRRRPVVGAGRGAGRLRDTPRPTW